MVFCPPSIVTVAASVAVCEIFTVLEWHYFENQVRGRSKSLKMVPFNIQTFEWYQFESPCMTSNPDFKVVISLNFK